MFLVVKNAHASSVPVRLSVRGCLRERRDDSVWPLEHEPASDQQEVHAVEHRHGVHHHLEYQCRACARCVRVACEAMRAIGRGLPARPRATARVSRPRPAAPTPRAATWALANKAAKMCPGRAEGKSMNDDWIGV